MYGGGQEGVHILGIEARPINLNQVGRLSVMYQYSLHASNLTLSAPTTDQRQTSPFNSNWEFQHTNISKKCFELSH